jgi:SAM-dependent methyltransferase
MSAPSVRHPIFARVYAFIGARAEDAGQGEHRDELLAGLTGRVVEVGAGDGLNFEHYPETVDEVIAIEPEPYLRERAERTAANARVPVTVLDGVAETLPLADASVDAGVLALVLCSVPSQAAALAELRRVLRPGGELRFYEHCARAEPALRPLPARGRRRVAAHRGWVPHPPRDAAGDRGRRLRRRGVPALQLPAERAHGARGPARARARAASLIAGHGRQATGGGTPSTLCRSSASQPPV